METKSDFRFSVGAAVSSVLKTALAAGLVFHMALATTEGLQWCWLSSRLHPLQGHSHSHDTGHIWRTEVILAVVQTASVQGQSFTRHWRTNSGVGYPPNCILCSLQSFTWCWSQLQDCYCWLSSKRHTLQGHSLSHDARHSWRLQWCWLFSKLHQCKVTVFHMMLATAAGLLLLVILQIAPSALYNLSHDTGHSCRTAVMLVIL